MSERSSERGPSGPAGGQEREEMSDDLNEDIVPPSQRGDDDSLLVFGLVVGLLAVLLIAVLIA